MYSNKIWLDGFEHNFNIISTATERKPDFLIYLDIDYQQLVLPSCRKDSQQLLERQEWFPHVKI
jgi:hypothetical protein